jgi:opacity protein-like surface antigen
MMFRRISVVATVIVLLAITMAQAKPKFEIQPYGSLRLKSAFGDGWYENDLLEKLSVASGGGFGFTLNVPVGIEGRKGQLGMFEFNFSYQKSDLRFEPTSLQDIPDSILNRYSVDGSEVILGNLDVMYIQIGGLYQFGNYSGWCPFVDGGLGASVFKAPDGEADTKSKFSISLGTGVTRMFSEKVGARLGFKGYFTSLPAEEAYWIDYYGNAWSITDSNWLIQGELSLGLVFAL